jgi:hypothetical protein
MNQDERERKFVNVVALALCALMVILALLGVIPILLCIALAVFVVVSAKLINRRVDDPLEENP